MTEEWTRERMLRALQADVHGWPQRVRDAGVTKINGTAYVPLARNNAILRTPDDPEATLAYMIEAWDTDEDWGSAGWYRIISQAGPDLTWESLMVDESKPYAPLFPERVRHRVAHALDQDAGTAEWRRRADERGRTQQARAERVAELRAEYRSGRRARPALPDLDGSLPGGSRRPS